LFNIRSRIVQQVATSNSRKKSFESAELARFLQHFDQIFFDPSRHKDSRFMSQSDRVLAPTSRALASSVAAGSKELPHARLRAHYETVERNALASFDEVLVVDERWKVRPAQVVESKLTRLLKDASLPVSHLQMRGLLRNR
jgi:hypothetical protein